MRYCIYWLVVWNMNGLWLSIQLGIEDHPNWQKSIIFQRGRYTTNQLIYLYSWCYIYNGNIIIYHLSITDVHGFSSCHDIKALSVGPKSLARSVNGGGPVPPRTWVARRGVFVLTWRYEKPYSTNPQMGNHELVGGLEHDFYIMLWLPYILGIIWIMIPTDSD